MLKTSPYALHPKNKFDFNFCVVNITNTLTHSTINFIVALYWFGHERSNGFQRNAVLSVSTGMT